ncbi:MAG: hypothetical protein R2826_06335 [Thermoleophilia bacterium]
MQSELAALVARVGRVREESHTFAVVCQGFAVTPSSVRGVHLVSMQVRGVPLSVSLWEDRSDVAILAGDARVPALSALLVMDEDQEGVLRSSGWELDAQRWVSSPALPDVRCAVLHYASRRQVRRMMQKSAMRIPATGVAA